MSERESTAKPHGYCSCQRKKEFLLNPISFHFLQESQLHYGSTIINAARHWPKCHYAACDCIHLAFVEYLLRCQEVSSLL